MIDFDRFLSQPRCCLIAPAGYGKTHSIVECLARTSGRQLILTHTHAGVAALREKLRNASIATSKYELSTISAVAQQLSTCFTAKKDACPQDDRAYFGWSLKRALELIHCPAIVKIFEMSYAGLLVDEYQDCTVLQHQFIELLGAKMPIRVFGDPMQGIFGFNDPLVDFTKDLSLYTRFQLDEPWRWKRTNPTLGLEIAHIRECLEKGSPITESEYNEIKFVTLERGELEVKIRELANSLQGSGSTLILANGPRREYRSHIAKLFGGGCSIVEAIDDREFYEQARVVDGLTTSNCCESLYNLATSLFFKTGVDVWLTPNGAKQKKSVSDREKSACLAKAIDGLKNKPDGSSFFMCIDALSKIAGIALLSHEKYFSLTSAIQSALSEGTSVLVAMRKERNVVRGMGRRPRRFSVGSTLLTKGLEFDNVIVCDYDSAYNLATEEGKRNFYVAVSRACKSLCIVRVKRIPFAERLARFRSNIGGQRT